MKVRILRVPPTRTLEGIDLGPYRFEKGHEYELGVSVATLLVVWGYAEPIGNGESSGTPGKQFA